MRLTLIFALFLSASALKAQNNLQRYTPSILFDNGDWEFKSFQNRYAQSKQFDTQGKKIDNGFTETFFTSINQFLYGYSNQLNIGLDVWVKSSKSTGNNLGSSSGITGLGPKIKIAPFKKIPRLSIQSTYLFNLTEDPEGSNGDRYFLEWDGNLWLNQVFFDLQLSDKSQLFFQQAFWYRLTKESSSVKDDFLQSQTSIFFSYFPTSRWTAYFMSEYFPTHYDYAGQKAEAFSSYFVQSGLGLKYQLIPNLIELEALYTNFWKGSEGQGAGETINLGIRVIHQ